MTNYEFFVYLTKICTAPWTMIKSNTPPPFFVPRITSIPSTRLTQHFVGWFEILQCKSLSKFPFPAKPVVKEFSIVIRQSSFSAFKINKSNKSRARGVIRHVSTNVNSVFHDRAFLKEKRRTSKEKISLKKRTTLKKLLDIGHGASYRNSRNSKNGFSEKSAFSLVLWRL